jgi:IclR family pca regulon transcriptional regulator
MSERVKSLVRGLAVLRSFTGDTPYQTLTQVALSTGLPRATARRMLLTLVDEGLITVNSGVFELTPRILQFGFGYLSSLTLTEIATPHLEALSARVGNSSSVAVLDGTDIVYVARVRARRIMNTSIGLGSRFPAYKTSMGRVILADRTDEEIIDIYEQSDRSLTTKYTVTSFRDLIARINEVRANGYATLDQELALGLRSISAPLRNSRGDVLAAVNISTEPQLASIDDLENDYVPALLNTAQLISDGLIAHDAVDLRPGSSS